MYPSKLVVEGLAGCIRSAGYVHQQELCLEELLVQKVLL